MQTKAMRRQEVQLAHLARCSRDIIQHGNLGCKQRPCADVRADHLAVVARALPADDCISNKLRQTRVSVKLR